MLKAKTLSHASAPRKRHTIARNLALAAWNALRGKKLPMTEQDHNLHGIFGVGRQHQEMKHWPRAVERTLCLGV